MAKKDDIKNIIHLQLERELRDTDPALAAKIRKNESFVGVSKNPVKEKKFEAVAEECAAICRSIPTAIMEKDCDDSTQRNGNVRLRLPCPVYIAAAPVMKRLSRLFDIADAAAVAANNGIVITFKIYDLWEE